MRAEALERAAERGEAGDFERLFDRLREEMSLLVHELTRSRRRIDARTGCRRRPACLEVLTRTLVSTQHEVIRAQDGGEAIAILQQPHALRSRFSTR
jgi:hypothetical protein